jgi:uncharacterized phage protein (TIGR02218 family)
MTSRPGGATLESLLWTHEKKICSLMLIKRRDRTILCVTDHDRAITFEGLVYAPMLIGALSAERREAAFRSGNQEARGIIDGTAITIEALDGKLYHGAEIQQIVTHWDRPWAVISRTRKWIRSINRTGSTWTGTLEGRSQTLSRTAGGRFGGAFSTTCQYKLGDSNCRADLSAFGRTLRVLSITDNKLKFRADPTVWTTGTSDDFYRGGEVEWRWEEDERNVLQSRTATAGGTTTTINDSTATWTPGEHIGKRLVVTEADGTVAIFAYITANTGTQLTYSPASVLSYGAGVKFQITGRGISSAATANTLTDSTQNWTIDQHAGKQLRRLFAPFGSVAAETTILSNTQTQLTFDEPIGATGSGIIFDICPRSKNWGTVSNILQHVDATRELTLLIPTPFPITKSSGGWARPGCDGLFTTCKAKFNNTLNFGGDPYAPSANQIIEPPS